MGLLFVLVFSRVSNYGSSVLEGLGIKGRVLRSLCNGGTENGRFGRCRLEGRNSRSILGILMIR